VHADVFAVEPDAVQVTWRAAPAGRHRVDVVDRGAALVATHEVDVDVDVAAGGGAGGTVVRGLPAGSDLSARIDDGPPVRFATPAPPTGAELFKLATINDLHIGATRFGFFGTIHERPAPAEPHPIRCARAAVAAALDWGAQLLVLKGDLTDKGWPEEWDRIGTLLHSLPIPVAIAPGNHDLSPLRTVEPQPELARHGLHLAHGVEVIELPGLRLVLADTVVPGSNHGRVADVHDDVCRVLARASGPAMVAMHHQPQRYRVTTYLPRGIPGPEAERFLAAVAAANRRTLVTTGHTHRHRRRVRHGLTVTEVGSTKDYPGAWSGYTVYEGGIRQTTYRITEPGCIRWTEQSGRAALGLWRYWAPGRLDDRSFTLRW
jgi:predicted phosphodiesterase